MKQILLDTNVVLDLALQRREFGGKQKDAMKQLISYEASSNFVILQT